MDYRIALSFFRIAPQHFEFTVFRKLRTQTDQAAQYNGCKVRRLPMVSWQEAQELGQDAEYPEYWVRSSPFDGSEEYECESYTNTYVTLDYLFEWLELQCAKLSDDEYQVDTHRFDPRILFTLVKHPEGNEVVWLQPYFLRVHGQYGFLADFKFDQPSYSKPNKHTLELSLAQKNDRPNRDFYADRFAKLQNFVSKYSSRIFTLCTTPKTIVIEKTLTEIDASRLRTKTYVFANGQTNNSQFMGVKQYGPLSPADDNIRLYFLYRAEDKGLSQDLFRALRGETFKTFPGMEAMFGFKMSNDRIRGMTIDSFESSDLEALCQRIEVDAGGRPVVPVVIGPFNRLGDESANQIYHLTKHILLQKRWPSQFVGRHTLINRNSLKWSVSNIGLALFAKMGGHPWKVLPQTNRCLIVGLGQAHRIVDDHVQKYFAYSVLTDSSGLYKDIRILGSSSSEEDYFRQFQIALRKVFTEFASDYDRFVIHATYKISKRELSAVESVIESLKASSSESPSNKEFVVMKFNDRNRFFGYSKSSNSLLPYESSYVQLSHSEYLVWFEGLQLYNPNVFKQIERPVHVEFIHPKTDIEIQRKINYLQDAVNLSGSNWRGFNAKSLPVSVYYAKLIATYFAEFQALELPEIDLEAIHPWFL